jgi:phosphoglycolate phosphatase-like HAD superfamily hydrolase
MGNLLANKVGLMMSAFDHSFWSRYHAVIFDCDDTVLATAKKRWVALIATAHLFHRELNEATIRASWGKPFDQLIADILPGLNLQTFLSTYQSVMRQFPPEATAGAVPLLQYLRSQGIRLEIVTSSYQNLILQDLGALGMMQYFSNVWGCEQTSPYHKPDPRVLKAVITALQIDGFIRSSIIYVGDSIRDYKVALGNNLYFIAVTSGLQDEYAFREVGLTAERIVASLELLIPSP